jgi:DNA-binding protein H-NS
MSKIKDLQAQIAALQAQVEEVKKTEVTDAIAKIRAIVEEYDLKASDIFATRGRKASTATKATGKRSEVAAKYKDPITGKTWSGRGLTPKWLAGKDKADYEIK